MTTLSGTLASEQRSQLNLVVNENLADVRSELESWFGTPFTIWDGETGQIVPGCKAAVVGNELLFESLVMQVAKKDSSEFLYDEEGVSVLALPICLSDHYFVASAAFNLSGKKIDKQTIASMAEALTSSPSQIKQWLNHQSQWTHASLQRMANLAMSKLESDVEVGRLSQEIENVSDSLSSTYEEISLLYGLTQNLRISSSESQLGELALQWLTEVLPCESLAICYDAGEKDLEKSKNDSSKIVTAGNCTVNAQQLFQVVQHLNINQNSTSYVANDRITQKKDWPLKEVRQLIAVPLVEGDNLFGWVFALNHSENKGFGTVEASLLSSVGTILGIHGGNIELYRQQADFVTSVVRALTSAIDAKDPYTCGHSDRVARLAVRLAKEFKCDDETMNLLYMAGLLHDVGKIGIDDNVLRKPGRLTEEEYEHIKQHPEMGYSILKDMKQLEEVLPVVLHHHEQWDGKGYPHGLSGTDTPILARITAVADSYDAMSSDRPYRKGMPEEKIDAIFKEGAGSQWDPEVIKAFFNAREDMKTIVNDEPTEQAFEFKDLNI